MGWVSKKKGFVRIRCITHVNILPWPRVVFYAELESSVLDKPNLSRIKSPNYPQRSKAATPPPRRKKILNFSGPERTNIEFQRSGGWKYWFLEVREASGRVPGEVFRAFWSFWKGFGRFFEVLSRFGVVLDGFHRELRGFGRVSGGEWATAGGGILAP